MENNTITHLSYPLTIHQNYNNINTQNYQPQQERYFLLDPEGRPMNLAGLLLSLSESTSKLINLSVEDIAILSKNFSHSSNEQLERSINLICYGKGMLASTVLLGIACTISSLAGMTLPFFMYALLAMGIFTSGSMIMQCKNIRQQVIRDEYHQLLRA